MVPLVVAPTGGTLTAEDADPVTVQRTFATARSVEFDALLFTTAPLPGKDADAGRDAKACAVPALTAAVDPRVVLMAGEAFRHAKALGALDGARGVLDAAGIPAAGPGVVVTPDIDRLLRGVTDLLTTHRVWNRFPPPQDTGA
jgi:catalase